MSPLSRSVCRRCPRPRSRRRGRGRLTTMPVMATSRKDDYRLPWVFARVPAPPVNPLPAPGPIQRIPRALDYRLSLGAWPICLERELCFEWRLSPPFGFLIGISSSDILLLLLFLTPTSNWVAPSEKGCSNHKLLQQQSSQMQQQQQQPHQQQRQQQQQQRQQQLQQQHQQQGLQQRQHQQQ